LFRNRMIFVLASSLFETMVVHRLTESACKILRVST
jgi:hypothetical protein